MSDDRFDSGFDHDTRRAFTKGELKALAETIKRKHGEKFAPVQEVPTLGMALMDAIGKLPVARDAVT